MTQQTSGTGSVINTPEISEDQVLGRHRCQMSEVDYEEDMPASAPSEEVYTLHVSNLSYKVDEEMLHLLFSSYGSTINETIVKEPIPPHRSRGFGFVSFKNESDADAALALNGHSLTHSLTYLLTYLLTYSLRQRGRRTID